MKTSLLSLLAVALCGCQFLKDEEPALEKAAAAVIEDVVKAEISSLESKEKK